MQIKICKNYILKLSYQILKWHWSHSKIFWGFSRKNAAKKSRKIDQKDLSRVAKFVSHDGTPKFLE